MNIPVVFASDDNYVIPTGVAITSMVLNKQKETSYDVYILSDNISPQNWEYLNQLNSEDVKIHMINYDKYALKDYKPGTHLSATTFLKFELPELFPQYDKLLWLDGDILVQKDLSDLFNQDVETVYAAAIRDMPGEVNFGFSKRARTKKYFNAGVLLMNTKKIRQDFKKEVFYKTLDEYPEFLTIGDQDVWNFRFQDKINWLSANYNLMMFNFLMLGYTIEMVNNFFGMNYASFEELLKDTYIVHLTNNQKPWNHKYVFMSKEWAYYHSQSPFKDMKIKYKDLDSFEAWAGENFVF